MSERNFVGPPGIEEQYARAMATPTLEEIEAHHMRRRWSAMYRDREPREPFFPPHLTVARGRR